MADVSVGNVFPYPRLFEGQIRLLQVFSKSERPVYKLSSISLDEAPPFIALSYAWDDQPKDQDLFVNQTVFKVIENVHTALPYLIRNSNYEHFWINGICINQHDNKEKAVQIPMMKNIFTKAAKVIVWLGESDTNIDEAIDQIPPLTPKLVIFIGKFELDPALASAGLPPTQSPFWTGVSRLLSRSWFGRLWTFQEVVLPHNVDIMCGSNVMAFDTLSTFVKALMSSYFGRLVAADQDTGLTVANSFSKIRMIAMYRDATGEYKEEMCRMQHLLTAARGWLVSNLSDTIYGLLGLSNEPVTVDYNMSPAEVYTAFAKSRITTDPDPWIFHAASSKVPMDGLPTWCPNFNSRALAFSFGGLAGSAGYCAGLDLALSTTCCVIGSGIANDIAVSGFPVDEVAEIVPGSWLLYVKPASAETRTRSQEWEAACLQLSRRVYKEPNTIPEAHWRTLIANKDETGKRYHDDGHRDYGLMQILLSVLAKQENPTPDYYDDLAALRAMTPPQDLAMHKYGLAMAHACQKRRFFSTTGGRVGLGPSNMKPGDQICIFYNGYTPFLIRPRPQPYNSTCNEFVGEAYVHGIMSGEALKMENKRQDQMFALC